MSHRNNFWHEQLVEHLDRRQWSEEDKAHFAHMVGHSALMSEQGVLAVLEYQQATDKRIGAERAQVEDDYNAVFAPDYMQSRFLRGQ